MARVLIHLPATIARGDVIEVRAMIAHPMETGYRPGPDGQVLPRDLIRRFRCWYDDGSARTLVLDAEFHPAIAANPYLAFPLRVTATGTLTLAWEGDRGFAQTETVALRVGA